MKINNLLLVAVFILILAFTSPAAGQAPSAGPSWSDPEDISNMPTNSAYPKVVAGPDGVVHVFWTENIPKYGGINDVIYYARRDSNGWSQPVDILISPQGLTAKADQPDVLLRKDGWLHLVFVGGYNGQIYYSSAKADNALESRSWSEPLLLSENVNQASNPNILEDSQGKLYVIFQSDQGNQQGLYETQSTDGGASWSQVSLIPGTSMSSDSLLMDTRAAISPQGVLHVTWAWTNLAEPFPPKGIFYIRSSDRGVTWSGVQSITDGPYRYPDVAVSGNNMVLMTWSGTSEDRFKFYRSSADGGMTWSDNITITTLGGMQGYSGLAVDSAGRLHLGMATSCYKLPGSNGEYSGDGLIHSTWDGTSLTIPELLLSNTIKENNLQYADIAISEGNIANIVVMYPIHAVGSSTTGTQNAQDYNFEIFYIRGVLDAPHIQPQPSGHVEAIRVTQTPTQAVLLQETKDPATSTPLAINPQFQDRATGFEINPSISVIIGAFPALLIIGAFMAVRLWYSKR